MREELQAVLLALACERAMNHRTLYDTVMSYCPPSCPPKPPCPPEPPCKPEPPHPSPCPPPPCESVRQAAAQLLGSIALEEAALSHVINAEGEKIQAAVAATRDIDKLLEVNASVADMLKNVDCLEQTLLAKLRLAAELARGDGGEPCCTDD